MAKKNLAQLDQLLIVSDIKDLMVKGYRNKDIRQFCETSYNLSEAQSDKYIKKAIEGFKVIDNKRKQQLKSKYTSRLEMMFHMALIDNKDIKTALSVQAELNKLLNLYQDEDEKSEPIKLVMQIED